MSFVCLPTRNVTEPGFLFWKSIYAYGVKKHDFFAILKIMCNFANDLTGRTFFNATQMLRLVVCN